MGGIEGKAEGEAQGPPALPLLNGTAKYRKNLGTPNGSTALEMRKSPGWGRAGNVRRAEVLSKGRPKEGLGQGAGGAVPTRFVDGMSLQESLGQSGNLKKENEG